MATSPAADYRSPAGMPLEGILLAEELLDLAERAQAYTNAAGVMIALMRGGELLVRTSAGSAPEVGTVIPAGDAFITECLQRCKPLSCRDTEADSRIGQIFRANKTRSLIAIPIAGQPEPRGVMFVIAPLPNAFQPTHTAILMTLSDIISSKLAAREAPAEVQIEIDPSPARAVLPETPPKPANPVMPVIAPAPVVASPPPMAVARPVMPATSFPPTKAAPPISESAPAPAAFEANWTAPEMPVVRSARPADSPEPVMIAPSAATPSAAGVPAVLKAGLMPLVEQKKSEREPGLLSPSEDPGRFTPLRASGNTAGRPELVKLNPRTVAPVATAAPAQPASFSASTAIASWETPRPDSGLRRYLVPALAVAAVLVVAAVLWVRRSTAVQSPPDTPVPAAAALTPPPATVAATQPPLTLLSPQVKLVAKVQPAVNQPGVKSVEEHAQPKPAKTPESQAAPAPSPAKHEPAPPMEIAAARPKPRLEPEPDMVAPKLALASGDSTLATLSKVAVAQPAPPKSELVPATLISHPAPVYPMMARQLGIAGTVELNVTVTTTGAVSDVRVIDGAMQLRAAAVDAVRQWRYKPAMLNGKPVESSAHVQVKFTR